MKPAAIVSRPTLHASPAQDVFTRFLRRAVEHHQERGPKAANCVTVDWVHGIIAIGSVGRSTSAILIQPNDADVIIRQPATGNETGFSLTTCIDDLLELLDGLRREARELAPF